ncbi:MAG TPA: hypothetical protein PKO07_17705 [Pseudomonadota bacterium]|nr:hypothetical protein [Pseudomonadota bacterium]
MFLKSFLVAALLCGATPSALAQITPDAPQAPQLGQPLTEAPPSLPPPAVVRSEPGQARFHKPAFTMAVVGGASFQYIIETPFLSGGAELRLGFMTRKVEFTTRLRMLAGSTLAGLVLLAPSISAGVMVPISQRVRIGAEVTLPPFVRGMLIRYVTQSDMGRAALVGAGFETSVDIVQWKDNRALFWVGTLGVDVTAVRVNGDSGQTASVGPNLFTGIGYRI